MHELQETLKNIGLLEKEAKVYLALLKFGSATVSDIAEEAGIKRPTAYVILDELRHKGLVLKIPHAKKTFFQAKTPDELYSQTISNVNRFEKILPKLRAINPSKKSIKTLYFEGIEGVKESLYYRIADLRGTTEEGFWAKNNGNFTQSLLELFDKWQTDRKKYDLLVGGVTPDHPSTREYIERWKEFYDELLLAPPEDYNSDVSIEVTKEFVRIIDGHEMKAIIIENPRVVDALGQIFALAKRNYQKPNNKKTA